MKLKEIFPPGSFSWAFYDFANTIYSAVVVTVYLPLYVTTLTARNTPLGLAATGSMILSGFIVPFLGILIDRTGKTKFYLFISTVLCVLSTCYLSFTRSVPLLLLTFMTANLLYHSSLVFYNSLLPAVAPPEKQGWVSGLGTALGYLGVLFALPAAHAVDTAAGRRWVFSLAGALFLLFSLPLFLHVPERKILRPPSPGWKKLFAILFENRPLRFLLLGNFFLLDALNAVILWLSVFLVKSFNLNQGSLIKTILALNASAFVFGILAGKLTDRIGYQKTLFLSIVSLGTVFLAVGLIPSFPWVCFFILLFGGPAAAGIWTAGRKGVIDLAPPDRIGECFGIYGFTTKVSAIGSTTLSVLADLFGFRAAVLCQLVSVALAFFFISRIPREGNLPQAKRTQ